MTGIVVKAKVKELVKAVDLDLSSDFMPKINLKVTQMVKDAIERAKANQRKTVMARDV